MWILTLPRAKNPIVTLKITFFFPRYHRINCCRSTSMDHWYSSLHVQNTVFKYWKGYVLLGQILNKYFVKFFTVRGWHLCTGYSIQLGNVHDMLLVRRQWTQSVSKRNYNFYSLKSLNQIKNGGGGEDDGGGESYTLPEIQINPDRYPHLYFC